jgi:aminodeoxyfutalosine synthase
MPAAPLADPEAISHAEALTRAGGAWEREMGGKDPFHVSDPALHPVAEKVRAGVVLDFHDGQALARSRDIWGIGRMANAVRERLHGDRTYYNRNRHINYTNVCALSCKFCSFYRKRGEAGAYEMPVEQVVATAKKAWDGGATEVHIVGGLHPWLKFDYYLDFLRGIRAECPGLHIKAFTAIEIVHFSRIARRGIEEVLRRLKEAGLGSLPGGGAEIFDDRVHDEAFKGKVREDKWFEVHRAAHRLGLFSNATMLYGHIEGSDERVKHLIKLRDLQAESLRAMGLDPDVPPAEGMGSEGTKRRSDGTAKGPDVQPSESGPSSPPFPACFNCVIPLSFIPEHSELGHLPGPTGLTDLKTLAIARLLCNNIAHIKSFWIMQGVHLSQIALNWGCDDLDGTVVWYDITKRQGVNGSAGGGTQRQEMHVETLKRVIRDAGRVPVERDTLYREIVR